VTYQDFLKTKIDISDEGTGEGGGAGTDGDCDAVRGVERKQGGVA